MFKLLLLLAVFLFAQVDTVTHLTHVAYNGKVWAATGYRNNYSHTQRTAVISTSYDSVSWTERSYEYASGAVFDDIAWLGGKFIAVGVGTALDGYSKSLIRFSEDDTNFNPTGQAPRPDPCPSMRIPIGDRLEKTRWKSGRWLARGYITAQSPDCVPYYGTHYYWSDVNNYLIWDRCTKADWDNAQTAVEISIVYDRSVRFVSLSLYDIKGRLIKRMPSIDFDKRGFASGVYILSLNNGVKIVNRVFVICR